MTRSRGISRLKGQRGSPSARFWNQVTVRPGACWDWTGAITRTGYGILGRDHGRAGGLVLAHRLSWEIHNGPIPAGMCVLHHCDNRPCTNPDHLFTGTRADNNRDMEEKGRAAHQKLGAFFPGRKLTAAQAVAIRRRRQDGLTYYALAAEFGVTYQTIGQIIRRETWPHV